jgi:voltage-gated potassium channel Kch
MNKPALAARWRYAFDNSLSKGPLALLFWLGLASAALIAGMATLVWVSGIAPADESGRRPGLVQIAWMGLMRTLDAGTMGGDSGSWPFLLAMLVITFGGIFVISTLIGSITSGIEEQLDELRKGRSRVLETNHVLVLGWTPQIFTVVSELVLANASQPKSCVVVLADKPKVEMEDELRERLGSTGRTRIVCRTGDPASGEDLDLCSIQATRTVIVLPPDGPNPDAHVVKTLLAITNSPRRRPEPYHIVAVVRDPKNMDVARLVGRDEVALIEIGDLLARITVQTCRQSGLSVVYLELLDFGGDEIYFAEEPTLVGRRFGDILLAYEKASIMGIIPKGGRAVLNPPMDHVLAPGERLIAIAEDDSTLAFTARTPRVDEALIRPPQAREPEPERTLILGSGARVPTLLRELAAYVAAGSEAVVVVPAGAEAPAAGQRGALHVRVVTGDVTERATLDALAPASFQHVVLLSDDGLAPQEADARTLFTLLHLRDIGQHSAQPFSIVSEMRDVRNRELAEVTRADDFIVGARLVSLMLAQLAENRELLSVFDDLFDPEGSEIYLKPAEDYVEPGQATAFDTVVAAARARGEVALGYRLKAQAMDAAHAYGVVVNPAKSASVRFAAGDRVIVLAES